MDTPPIIAGSLRVLGSLGYDGPDLKAARPILRQPKRASVLVYLLLRDPGSFVSRDDLLAVFWPETDETHARNALRQTLAFIRSHLGPNAVENRGRQYVRASRDAIGCDALAFEALIDGGNLLDALSLYRGSFLSGLHINGCTVFSDWLEERRSHYQGRAAAAAWELAESLAGSRRPLEASFWGKRALAYSQFGEIEVRRLIGLLDQVGDRAGALRAYQGLERYLEKEFGCAPSPETQELVTRVQNRASVVGGGLPTPSARRSGLDRRQTKDRRTIVHTMPHAERRQQLRRVGERRQHPDRRSFRNGT